MKTSRARLRRLAHAVPLALVVGIVLLPSLAPATVEEQRARLPPPAQPDTCQNPVEGVWKSLRWYPGNAAWYSFELEIHQHGNTLSGSIRAHSWDTPETQVEPGPCRAGLSHWIVYQTALGSVDGNLRIDFAATRWAVERSFCGTQPFGYNLDHFRGVIDTRLQEFQSVNNDGGAQIDEPTVFRRIRCFEPQQPPHPYVAPPPLQPPRRGWGCNNRR